MQVIAVASQKGGAGKSTLCAHLGVLADRDGACVLFDTDAQGSLTFWHGLRTAETPALVKCQPREVAEVLELARRDGVKWAVVDTPPHDSAGIAQVMRSADLVVIPSRPATFDLAAISTSIIMARELSRPHMVVINAAHPRRGVGEASVVAEARQVIEGMGAPCWRGVITQRAAMAHALANGEAVTEFESEGAAAGEVAALWRDIRKAALTVRAAAA